MQDHLIVEAEFAVLADSIQNIDRDGQEHVRDRFLDLGDIVCRDVPKYCRTRREWVIDQFQLPRIPAMDEHVFHRFSVLVVDLPDGGTAAVRTRGFELEALKTKLERFLMFKHLFQRYLNTAWLSAAVFSLTDQVTGKFIEDAQKHIAVSEQVHAVFQRDAGDLEVGIREDLFIILLYLLAGRIGT